MTQNRWRQSTIISIVLFSSFGMADEYKSVKEAVSAGTKKMYARDFDGARADAAAAMKLSTSPGERIEARLLSAWIDSRAGKHESAIKGYTEILAGKESSVDQSMRACFGLADVWSAQKEYNKARSELDKSLALEGLPSANRFDALIRKAVSFERESDWDGARRLYGTFASEKDVNGYWLMRAGQASAKTFISQGKFDEARGAYQKLFATPEINDSTRKNLHLGIAQAYERELRWPEARKEYEKALALPALNESDKLNVLCEIADTFGGQGDPRAMKSTIEKLMPLKGPASWKVGRLLDLGSIALKQADTEIAAYSFNQLLTLPDLSDRYKQEAWFKLAEIRVMQRDLTGLETVMLSASTDTALSAKERLKAKAVLAGIRAVRNGSSAPGQAFKKAAEEFAKEASEPADRLDAFSYASQCFMKLRNYEMAREFLALADSLLVEAPRKTYSCRYMETPPLGAAGWSSSALLQDQTLRESRFEDYNQQDAAQLITDATIEREFTKDKEKSYYYEHTGFYMAYDKTGWHMFVLSGEPNTENILADGTGAGALEMYFCPGSEGETYYQWIIELPKGKLDLYDWNSPHRHFRPLKEAFKTETIAFGKNWGTYIFIPWEVLHDKLPLDGGEWPFGFIRWTPAGGITWGGKVHEIGKWGSVAWQKPTDQQALTIRKNVLRKAWGNYKAARKIKETYWKDEALGDPEFWQTSLSPFVEKLNSYGEPMNAPAELTSNDVEHLFKVALGDWMEFDYTVSELRNQWLEERLFKREK
ncbi:MAG: tetratricopeptide repeat protein [Planctomycetota bacterium]|nr:tetratricopeptide repeat protein [Planctomycetota bacterium]